MVQVAYALDPVSAALHLNNKEAKREPKVNYNNETCASAQRPNTSE